jgi:hypothetical protein
MALIWDEWVPNSGATCLGEMLSKLKVVQARLQGWDQNVFGSLRKMLASLRASWRRNKVDPLFLGRLGGRLDYGAYL